MKRSKKLLMGVSFIAILFVTGSGLSAQTDSIFRRISNQFSSYGYTRVGAPDTGWLEDGESTTVSVWMSAGRIYSVAAACDNDCSDVDLRLFSPEGVELDADLAEDDRPIVSNAPSRSGTYKVRVSMAECSVEPCEYYLGVFRK